MSYRRPLGISSGGIVGDEANYIDSDADSSGYISLGEEDFVPMAMTFGSGDSWLIDKIKFKMDWQCGLWDAEISIFIYHGGVAFDPTIFYDSNVPDWDAATMNLVYQEHSFTAVAIASIIHIIQNNGSEEYDLLLYDFQVNTLAPVGASLSLPVDNAIDVAVNPTLSWTNGLAGTITNMKVYLKAGAGDSVEQYSGVAKTSHDLSGLLNSTIYQWKVETTNVEGATMSATFTFTTVAAAGIASLFTLGETPDPLMKGLICI